MHLGFLCRRTDDQDKLLLLQEQIFKKRKVMNEAQEAMCMMEKPFFMNFIFFNVLLIHIVGSWIIQYLPKDIFYSLSFTVTKLRVWGRRNPKLSFTKVRW